ncbi:hypothetical protein Tco_0265427 [Tanacetum coccineum]
MADDRPMAEQLQAPTGGFESAIVFTTINAQNFETKSLTFNLVSKIEFFESYNDQDSLNSTAGGNFLYKSPTEGLQIIENKAKVRCSRNAVMRVSTNALPSSSTSSSSNFEFPTNGITTRSGIVLDGPLPPMPPPYVNPDNEKAKETKVTKDKVQPESSQSTANVQPRVDHGKGKDKLKDNEKGMKRRKKMMRKNGVVDDIPQTLAAELGFELRTPVVDAYHIWEKANVGISPLKAKNMPKDGKYDVLIVSQCAGKDIKVKKSKNEQKPTRNEETSTRERFEANIESQIKTVVEKSQESKEKDKGNDHYTL